MAKPCVLIVDDEAINRMLLNEYLLDAGYETVDAEGGVEALSILDQFPDRFDAILLDRMMPDMEGLTVLKKIKQNHLIKDIPVIIQTAKAMKEEIREGLECGSYYYLTKPFDRQTLLTILQAAIEQYQSHSKLISELEETSNSLAMMKEGVFQCRSLEEARSLSKLLAMGCPEPSRIVTGLSELIINGIEHGNLAISYSDKTELLNSGQLYQEIERRMSLDEYSNKKVTVHFRRDDDQIVFKIIDEGSGFDFKKFINIDLSQVVDSHGRGIAMAKLLSFSEISYKDKGNEVWAIISTLPA